MTRAELELFFFTLDETAAARATRAGADGIVVDWETRGKRRRQAYADTEINAGTLADLRRVRSATPARLICRINRFGPQTEREIERTLAGGADEILLPMVRHPSEVEATLELVNGRCATGILVETQDAVAAAPELAAYPLCRVYVGLNDLAIDRGSRSIFSAVADGTVGRLSQVFEVPFGFAGATVPDRGDPVPCRLLIAEMARLGCAFTFLRRSYRRDVDHSEAGQRAAIRAIREAFSAACARMADEVERDRTELEGVCHREASVLARA